MIFSAHNQLAAREDAVRLEIKCTVTAIRGVVSNGMGVDPEHVGPHAFRLFFADVEFSSARLLIWVAVLKSNCGG